MGDVLNEASRIRKSQTEEGMCDPPRTPAPKDLTALKAWARGLYKQIAETTEAHNG